jgi:voltage-gated potassium channel
MFALTLLFLALVAAFARIIPDLGAGHEMPGTWLLLGGLAVLWPVFLAEAVLRFFLQPRSRRTAWNLASTLVSGLLPPLRLAARSATRPNHLWLPWLGWREVSYDLEKTLERFFGAPMFVIALLILPVLAIHYFWSEQVEAAPVLRLVLDISTSLIWVAFTTEFIIRISAAEKKLSYALTHWIDLAIVLLPTIEFMPFLRVLRLTQVARLRALTPLLNSYAKYYRLYGLAGKGWRALIVLEVLHRVLSRSADARLARLRSQLETKEEEARELQREIDYYRRQIEHLESQRSERADSRPESSDGAAGPEAHAGTTLPVGQQDA